MMSRLKIVAAVVIAAVLSVSVAACGDIASKMSGSAGLKIVAATELKDLEPLIAQASKELGFKIEMSYPDGTIANSLALKNGEFDGQYDATWFATNKYVDLHGAGEKLSSSTSIATSPVAFGVRSAKARELGWTNKQPTWPEITDAVKQKKFTYGMTDPSRSNSGFSALVSVATAQADTGAALQLPDVERVQPGLREFFAGQNLTSGSSGWLEEVFAADPNRSDAIINYESVLVKLKQDKNADIEVIVPADGVVTADYPLATLAKPRDGKAKERTAKLTEWLIAHSNQITADTMRRPVSPQVTLPNALAKSNLIELPFPARLDVADELVFSFANELRQPAKTVFVLDRSGSMRGKRMTSLQGILSELIAGTARTKTGPVSFRNREDITLISFNDEVDPPIVGTYSRSNQAANAPIKSGVDNLQATGGTAIYDALEQSYNQFSDAELRDHIPSIVLMSDGASNVGHRIDDFQRFHAGLSPEKRRIPIFVILYGEANRDEMTKLADLTEGKTFDATSGELGEAFKEIRGYQ